MAMVNLIGFHPLLGLLECHRLGEALSTHGPSRGFRHLWDFMHAVDSSVMVPLSLFGLINGLRKMKHFASSILDFSLLQRTRRHECMIFGTMAIGLSLFVVTFTHGRFKASYGSLLLTRSPPKPSFTGGVWTLAQSNCAALGVVMSWRHVRTTFSHAILVGQYGALFFNGGGYHDGLTKDKLGPAGCGGILCNSDGYVVGVFLGPLGIQDSNFAELMAILHVVRFFSYSSFTSSKLIIEFDSKNALS
ncbi:Uncharacterized protein TCM_025122 [Theobroma cacao]|uniref:RNase H type-1 domain-containing protein n=1 Tax=Theobroma cacao TaxID=3641 RepID=A0A061F5F6_THECC|nr:Uncharacterized protein TCM_025122 [Theobroma cacao]